MKNYKKYGLFVLVCVIFGNTFLAISMGLKAGASPLFYGGLRFLSAGILMLLVLILWKKTPFLKIRGLLIRSFVLSLFLVSGTFGLMFIAQTKVDSGFMARIDSVGPVITALLATLFLKKKLTRIHLAALLLGSLGTILIATPSSNSEPLFVLAAAGSVLLYAMGTSLYPLLFQSQEDPVLISALQNILGGLVLVIIAVATEKVSLPFEAFGPFLYLVIGGSVIGQTLTLVLVNQAGPVFASGWLYVAPVIATVSGRLVLDERITPGGILGTFLALFGTFILGWAENEKTQRTA